MWEITNPNHTEGPLRLDYFHTLTDKDRRRPRLGLHNNVNDVPNVEELRQRIVDEWERLDQRIIDGAVKEW